MQRMLKSYVSWQSQAMCVGCAASFCHRTYNAWIVVEWVYITNASGITSSRSCVWRQHRGRQQNKWLWSHWIEQPLRRCYAYPTCLVESSKFRFSDLPYELSAAMRHVQQVFVTWLYTVSLHDPDLNYLCTFMLHHQPQWHYMHQTLQDRTLLSIEDNVTLQWLDVQ